MTYTPEKTDATCAWCGESISYAPHWGDYCWTTSPPSARDSGLCYEENPHVPDFDIVVRRDGAASRTADELAAVFIMDVADLVVRVPVDWQKVDAEGYALIVLVTGWCENPDDSQALSDAIPIWEDYLADAGYAVEWDDGYQIWRVAS